MTPPEAAPNIVVILLDDVGFGQPGTFGGPFPHPPGQLAGGFRYNRFHTTGICSPIASGIANGPKPSHAANGTITELSTGFPGYNSVIPKSTATIARILRDNGYSTSMCGKSHNTPDWETNAVGPFNHWPTGTGFEYFYGFQMAKPASGNRSSIRIQLRSNHRENRGEGYHLTEDMVDNAIGWMTTHESISPDRPFFIYMATGAAHAPLHAPKEWIEKFKGQFDKAGTGRREETLARQKKMGYRACKHQTHASSERDRSLGLTQR